jgi:hypothetical protein
MELFTIALVLLACYGLVRVFARGFSALTGSRFRAYRSLASKFRGRYESRGFVDPPTVSFTHQGSSVRVGLAPVLPGQSTVPRTRVVIRFPTGLPFRLELMPMGRPAPPQPPKGTRPVTLGLAEFDGQYQVWANDAEMARTFLETAGIRERLEGLRRLAPPYGMLVSVNPERLLVQIDRDMASMTPQLELAVRNSLAVHDSLQSSVLSRVRDGVSIVEGASGGARLEASEEAPECRVCGVGIEGDHVVCVQCRTPFHRDCWNFVGGCSTYGCRSKKCQGA